MQSDFLGLILIAQGSISRDDLFAGLRRQSQTGEMLGEALVELGVLTAENLERGLAVQIGAPHFELSWVTEPMPEVPCELPEGLDVRLIYACEGLEIWGVRTPAGRAWLQERTREFDGEIGVYVLPDRAWREPKPERQEVALEPSQLEDAPLSAHEAIESLYESESLEAQLKALARGLHDMFAHISVASVDDNELKMVWQAGTEISVERFERCEPVEGWRVDEASEALRETIAAHGWRLAFGVETGLLGVIYAFDDDIDDPIVFQELTREFESAHKLLMERVNSG